MRAQPGIHRDAHVVGILVVVAIVAGLDARLLEMIFLIERAGGGIADAHFQRQLAGILRQRAPDHARQQQLPQPQPAKVRVRGDRADVRLSLREPEAAIAHHRPVPGRRRRPAQPGQQPRREGDRFRLRIKQADHHHRAEGILADLIAVDAGGPGNRERLTVDSDDLRDIGEVHPAQHVIRLAVHGCGTPGWWR